jgi:hypothetical protein
MKIKKNGMTKIVDKNLWDYYANKGWTTEEDGEIRAVLKPAKLNTAKTPAVESVKVEIDEEVVVNDETKGE